MIHFVHTFLMMRAYGVRLIVIEEVQKYGITVFIKNIFENGGGRMHTFHSTLLIRPWPYPTKPIKESGKFLSLGTISFVLFY